MNPQIEFFIDKTKEPELFDFFRSIGLVVPAFVERLKDLNVIDSLEFQPDMWRYYIFPKDSEVITYFTKKEGVYAIVPFDSNYNRISVPAIEYDRSLCDISGSMIPARLYANTFGMSNEDAEKIRLLYKKLKNWVIKKSEKRLFDGDVCLFVD